MITFILIGPRMTAPVWSKWSGIPAPLSYLEVSHWCLYRKCFFLAATTINKDNNQNRKVWSKPRFGVGKATGTLFYLRSRLPLGKKQTTVMEQGGARQQPCNLTDDLFH